MTEPRDADPAVARRTPARSRVRGLAGDSLRLLLASGGIQLANVVTGVLLARMLGPAGKGALTAILLWPGLVVAILSLGIYESVTYYAAVDRSRGRQVAGSAILIALLQSGVAVATWLLILPLVLAHYGQEIVADGRVYAIWIPFYLVATVAMGVLLGRMEIGLYNGLRLAQALLVVVGLVLLVIAQAHNIAVVLVVYLAVHAVAAIASLALVGLRGGIGLPSDLAVIRHLTAFGLKSHVGSLSGLANERADLAVIALFLPATALGFYSVAVTVTAPVLVLGAALASIALPAVASAGSPSERHDRGARFVRLAVALSFASALVGAVIGPWLIVLFFGRAFAPAGLASQVLFAAAIPLSANRVLGAVLKAHNQPLRTGVAEMIALVATIASLIILLPLWGIVGAAVASGIAYCVSSAVLTTGLTRIGYRVAELFIPTPADVRALLAHLRRTTASVGP